MRGGGGGGGGGLMREGEVGDERGEVGIDPKNTHVTASASGTQLRTAAEVTH